MSTLRLAPDEFALLRKVIAAISEVTPEDAARQYTAAEIRSFLAGSVTAVAPGETLVIRVTDLTPMQMCEYQESLDRPGLPFRCLVVYGESLGVVQGSGDD